MEPLTTSMKFRLAFSIIGIFVGLSVALVFGIVYNNIDTAVWGLMSGVFAGVTLAVHVQQIRDRWSTHSPLLRYLMLLGCLGQLASVIAAIAYVTIAIVEKQSLTPSGRGYYLSFVWTLMTWKWTFLLFLCSRIYRRQYQERTQQNPDIGYEKIQPSSSA